MIKLKAAQKSKKLIKALSTYKRLSGNIGEEICKGLHAVGRGNVKETRRLMTDEPKTGRWYLYKGRRYRASAPREAPAIRSGKLRKSVGYVTNGTDQVEFGDREEYGKYLELGTQKMAPRPHLSRTVAKRAQINRKLILEHDIERIIK